MLRACGRLVLVVAALAVATPIQAAEMILLVRHAERQTGQGDDGLSEAGQRRAARLSAMLAEAGITHIFTSDRRRTVETAAPLASLRRLMAFVIGIEETKPGRPDPVQVQVAATLGAIRDAPGFSRVLIVGHSNTLPEFLKALGVAEAVTIADDEFDNLFVVLPQPTGPPHLVRLRF